MIITNSFINNLPVLKNILSQEDVTLLRRYFDYLKSYKVFHIKTDEGNRKLNRYGDIVSESLMLELLPTIEELTDKRLFPTYSYIRTYHEGSVLKSHLDRPACEISITITLDYESNSPIWPIYIETNGAETAVQLDKGEGLIYWGCEMRHWRNEYEGDFSTHAFLHYVDADGSNVSQKYDNRKQIFGKNNFRKILQSRLLTFDKLDGLSFSSLINPNFYMSHDVKENGVFAEIKIDDWKIISLPSLMIPIAQKVLNQLEPFRLSEIFDKSNLNETWLLSLMKQLILSDCYDLLDTPVGLG